MSCIYSPECADLRITADVIGLPTPDSRFGTSNGCEDFERETERGGAPMSEPLLLWTVGKRVVRVSRAHGHAESVTYDEHAEIDHRGYFIKNQADGSWVVVKVVDGVEVDYAIRDSEDAAKQQAEDWERSQ
jgi:hypothetical protein